MVFADRTAVVLGGTGYVGRWVCAALRDTGWRVVAAARNAADPVPGCAGVQLDAARRPAEVHDLLRTHEPQLVVNAAGAAWQLAGSHVEEANVALVENLVRALSELPRPPRLVHLGTMYEYGPQPRDAYLREDMPAAPNTHYAATKLGGTEAVLAARHLDAVVLRLSTAVGAGAPARSLFATVSRQLVEGGPVSLSPAGLHREQDFVDVRDVADAVVAAGAAHRVTGLFNIASGVPVRVGAAVDRLIEISGVPAEIVDVDVELQRSAPSAEPQLVAIDAARRALGWAPRRTLTDALTAVWQGATAGLSYSTDRGI
jgi:nucleoside-diphosphate-sugar epimerase